MTTTARDERNRMIEADGGDKSFQRANTRGPVALGGLARHLILAIGLALGGAACQTNQDVGRGVREQAAQAHMAEAQDFLDRGQLDSALAAFGLALEENPTLVDAYMGMGSIYHERGDYELASRSYERATNIEPNNFDAQYYLGLMHQLVGRIEQAISTYLRALAIDPDHYDANANLASAYLQLGQAESALPYAKRATQLRPDDQAAWANLAATYSLMRDYRQAVSAYRRASELGEAAQPILLGLAEAHIRMGNFPEAENVLRSVLGIEPSAPAFERMGYILFKQQRFVDALNHFNQALNINPSDTAALNGVGVAKMTLFLKGGRTERNLKDDAISAWRKSLRLEPDQPRILDLLSRYQSI